MNYIDGYLNRKFKKKRLEKYFASDEFLYGCKKNVVNIKKDDKYTYNKTETNNIDNGEGFVVFIFIAIIIIVVAVITH